MQSHKSPTPGKLLRRYGPPLISLLYNSIVYYGARLLTGQAHHYDLSLPIDRLIPFVPWTVVIYLVCYLFWAVNYVLACQQEPEAVYRFFSADLMAKTVCLLCFLLLPTTLVRPVPGDATLFCRITGALYTVDAADNLFPSIHCLTSYFCFIAVRRRPEIPRPYRVFSLLFALAVCVSTLTVRQHVFVDVVAGVLLAEISYQLVARTPLPRIYRRAMSALFERL